MPGWAVLLFGYLSSGLPKWDSALIFKLNCTTSKLLGTETVLISLGTSLSSAVTQPLGWNSFTSSSQNRQLEVVCSHPCRIAPREMKTQDISVTPQFSVNSFHTQNCISVKPEYTNISIKDQDTQTCKKGKWKYSLEVFWQFSKYVRTSNLWIRMEDSSVSWWYQTTQFCSFGGGGVFFFLKLFRRF